MLIFGTDMCMQLHEFQRRLLLKPIRIPINLCIFFLFVNVLSTDCRKGQRESFWR